MRYSVEPKHRKYIAGYGFCLLEENLKIHMVKNNGYCNKIQE